MEREGDKGKADRGGKVERMLRENRGRGNERRREIRKNADGLEMVEKDEGGCREERG